VTKSIGLVATTPTTFNDPFAVARQFASLDHLSGGRAGWNIVTSTAPAAAANYGADELPGHDARYARADEFVEVVCKLWASWERDAIVADQAEGIYLGADSVHEINHDGPHFRVKGPLNVPRPPQGRPPLVQAGSSPTGCAWRRSTQISSYDADRHGGEQTIHRESPQAVVRRGA
jgi:alkanesulfonate monooxygenase SsuD/methylene tetrahydromethanopterin reductase-like flavin-dependent oxidoreductase (luciferase family)